MRQPPAPSDGREPTAWVRPETAAEFTGVPLERILELVETGRVRVRYGKSRCRRAQVNLIDLVAVEGRDLVGDQLWLSPAATAARVGIDRQRISDWVTQGRVRTSRSGPGEIKVNVGDVRRLVQPKGTR